MTPVLLLGAVVGASAAIAPAGPGEVYAPLGALLAAAPRATPDDVRVLREPSSGMGLVPATSFPMGSSDVELLTALSDCIAEPTGDRCDASMFADELPRRTVTLDAYWLDRTEVTVEAYDRCVDAGRCRALATDGGARRYHQPGLPVTRVTWEEAVAYCAFRGARLPTEAEFERAARGVTERRYPWGRLFNSHVVNHGRFAWDPTDGSDGFRELSPVGAFPEGGTPEGFLDLAGNASEWVVDRYAPAYSAADVLNPVGPASSGGTPARVVRGGSYQSGRAWLRGAARTAADPATRRPWIGFRCARSATPGPGPTP